MTNAISLISTVSKVFEIIIKKRFLKFIEKYQIFNKRQYGFMPGRSPDYAIFDHVSTIARCREAKDEVTAVYVHPRKVFHTGNHDILVRKLENAGFGGKILTWPVSYLKGRRQAVTIGKERSEFC